MTSKITLILLIIITSFLIGCKAQTTRGIAQIQPGVNLNSDSNSVCCKENLEILEYVVTSDTLKIISTSNFLYYPFGDFYSKNDFLHYTNGIGVGKFESGRYDGGIKFYRFEYKGSYLRFLEGEKGKLEIVGAKIVDAEIALRNEVKVSLGFNDVLLRFTDKISQAEITKIQVIELISGLEGVWQYYQFKNGILSSIYIDTDYYFDKK